MNWLRRLWFNLAYFGSPPWDTGVTPPELEAFIEQHPPGRALDLGCGTGTNVIALARAGWQADGVDFAGRAVRIARRRARRLGLPARFLQGDVTRISGLKGPYDLVLDIGCFHAIDPDRQANYARGVAARLKPGGTYMLFTFFRSPGAAGPGITENRLAAAFSSFTLVRREDGTSTGDRPSAWLWFRSADRAISG